MPGPRHGLVRVGVKISSKQHEEQQNILSAVHKNAPYIHTYVNDTRSKNRPRTREPRSSVKTQLFSPTDRRNNPHRQEQHLHQHRLPPLRSEGGGLPVRGAQNQTKTDSALVPLTLRSGVHKTNQNSLCLGAVDLEVVLHHARQEVVRVGELPEHRLPLRRCLHLHDDATAVT